MTFNSKLSWIILAFSALNVVFLGGKRRAFGIFIAQLHVEFKNTSLAELNWIGDSYSALAYLTVGLSNALILRFNRPFRIFQFIGSCFILLACLTSAFVPSPHWLFLTHTILHGIGSSLVLSTVGLVVNEHFDKEHKYHILATTLVSGGSVASIIFVKIYTYLIEEFGWRHSFTILGWTYFVVTATSAIVFVRNTDKEVQHAAKCSFNFEGHITPAKMPLLCLWTADRVLTSVVTYGMMLNLADYMRTYESSLSKSAILTTLFAAGEATTYALGAIITALTKDFFKHRLKYILMVGTFLMGTALVTWEVFANNRLVSRLLAYISGFCLGPSITFLFPAGEEMTTLPGHLAYPFSLFGMGLGMAISPLLSAFIAQAFQYKGFFLVQGIIIYIKFICLLSASIRLKALGHNMPVDTDSAENNDSVDDDVITVESDDQLSRLRYSKA